MKLIVAVLASLALSTSALADIEVSQAHARAVPPGQSNSAAFMTLKNNSADQVALIGGTSSVATAVELHTHNHDNGVMQMRRIPQVTLLGHDQVTLKPGGLHIMLIGLNKPLQAGETIDLQLDFSDGSSQQLTVPVQPVMAAMGKKHSH